MVKNDETKTFKFKKFKLSWLKDDAAILLLAPRRSGKSWIIRAILYEKKDIPVCVIICTTEGVNHFFDKFFYDLFIYDNYSSRILEKIFKRQVILTDKKERKEKEGKFVDNRIIFIMDDCLADNKNWSKDELIRKILMNGRHYGIMYILTMQYAIGISPGLRTNFDYAFLLADNNINNQKKMYENFAGCFETFKDFQAVYKKFTADHGAMVINAKASGNFDIEKNIFFYKAPNLNNIDFKFGNSRLSKYVSKHFDETYKVKKMKDMLKPTTKNKYEIRIER